MGSPGKEFQKSDLSRSHTSIDKLPSCLQGAKHGTFPGLHPSDGCPSFFLRHIVLNAVEVDPTSEMEKQRQEENCKADKKTREGNYVHIMQLTAEHRQASITFMTSALGQAPAGPVCPPSWEVGLAVCLLCLRTQSQVALSHWFTFLYLTFSTYKMGFIVLPPCRVNGNIK